LSLSPGDQATIIGVGVAVLLGVGAGIFKASGLRGDLNSKWKRRVTLAISVLNEKAVEELRLLRIQINGILPPQPSDFDPSDVITDPAPLVKRADKAAQYYRASTGMERNFVWLRHLCPALVAALSATELSTVSLTAYYSELAHLTWVRVGGLILLGVAVLVLVISVMSYAILQHRLSGAEILAGTGGIEQGDQ
jgi:hypothetical protein